MPPPPSMHAALAVLTTASWFAAVVPSVADNAADGLTINEFAADPGDAFPDADGDNSDWIELLNTGPAPVSTDGFHLTDDVANLTKWRLPDVTIPSGDYLVVFASGKDRSDPAEELHANFSLASGGEYLALVAPDGTSVLCEFAPEYPRQFFGESYGIGRNTSESEEQLIASPADVRWFVPSSDIGDTWKSPGFNDAAWNSGVTGVGFGYPGMVGAGSDTELFMRGINASVYLRLPFQIDDPLGVRSLTLDALFDDGFAAFLNGHPVASVDAPDPLQFNSVATDSRSVDPGDPFQPFPLAFENRLVAGENILAIQLLNFRSTSGDLLMTAELRGLIRDISGGAQRLYFANPTPGAENAGVTYADFVRDTGFSVDRGFFDAPFDVTITSSTPGATIVYTTDGNSPTPAHGVQVPAPDDLTPPTATVTISTTTPLRAAAFKDGLRPTNIDTQTYLFLDDVLDQPVQPAGYPLPWRQRNGNTINGDYEMDQNVVGVIYSRAELKDALLDVPTVSIVTDIANLFDQQTGIQVNPQDSGPGSERPVSVELLNFEDGAPVQDDAGMLMNGNASRAPSRPKHNFRLAYRNEYGTGRLNFPLFGADAPTSRFNQIILRGGNGNSWIHPTPAVYNNAMYIRDQWFRDAHFAMGYPEALQREVHVYFNGLYWGMHHLFERIEEEWAAERFGGREEDWEGFRIVGGNNIEVIQGTPAEESARMLASWQATLDAAQAGDLEGVQEYLDLTAFIDYVLLNFHAGNTDWDQNNVRAMRRIRPPGKYMFFCHDAERAGLNALSTGNVSVNSITHNRNPPEHRPTSINAWLTPNPDYAIRFADRAQKHLFNGGALTPENGMAQWEARADGIREAMKAESARWGDFRGEPPRTLVNWENSLNREYTQWFPARTPITISQLRAAGLFPNTEAPTFSQHGGEVAPGFSLQITNVGGAIYYTTDGSDPRLEGGGVSPNAVMLPGGRIDTTFVAEASSWKYLGDGTDLGTAWRAPAFDDAAWAENLAPLGFGDLSNMTIATVVDPPPGVLTVYFRKTVNVTNAGQVLNLTLRIGADGGAVVYINGVEAVRDNMPQAGDILFGTPSSSDGEEGAFDGIYELDPALFVDGDNVIAVEVHNVTPGSSDMGFDLSLAGEQSNPLNLPVSLNATTQIRARSLDDGEWSALNEATFIVGDAATSGNLAVTEIFYNPAGPGEETEYIELMNIGPNPIALAGVTFTGGIQFVFGNSDTLAPGERLLLVADAAAFEAAFGAGHPVVGEYTGRLDNGGETLTLVGIDGSDIRDFRYNDRGDWPPSADGSGYALVLVNPEGNPDPALPVHWRASVDMGGSPGGSDVMPFAGDPAGDADGNGIADLLDHALGNDPGDPAIRTQTRIEDGFLVFTFPRNLAADDVTFDVEFSSDLRSWQGGQAVFDGYEQRNGGISIMRWKSIVALDDANAAPFARLVVGLR